MRPRRDWRLPFFICMTLMWVFLAQTGQAALGQRWLKANYKLQRPHITHEQLGLRENEVLKANFSETSRFDEPHDYDDVLLRSAIQGMLNRHGPLVFLDNTIWGWKGDETWVPYYQTYHGKSFVPVEPGLGNLLKAVGHVFNGIIVYEPEPSDNIFLAANLANLNFCLPVSQRIYQRHGDVLSHLPVIAYIDRDVMSRKQIYRWMIRHVMARTDKTMAYTPSSNFSDLTLMVNPWEEYIAGLDYPFFRKAFIYNISGFSAPTKVGDVIVDGSPYMGRQFNHIMRRLNRPAAIFGWCTSEAEFSPYGHYQCASTAAPNLSFHGAIPPMTRPPYRQDLTPSLSSPEHKVYIAVVANEGDTAVVTTQFYYGAWLDPARGQVPMTWAVNPTYATLFPSMMECLIRSRSENDLFVMGPSGAGYVHPDKMCRWYLRGFLRHTSRQMRKGFNCPDVVLWEGDRERTLNMYARHLRGLRGMTVKPNGIYPQGETFYLKDGTPVIREGKGHYWQTKEDFFDPGYRLKIPEMKAFLDHVYEAQSKPFFVILYGLQDNMPSEIVKLNDALDPNRFELVDLGTLFHLAELCAPHPWTQRYMRRPNQWEALNEAHVGKTFFGGLKVQVASGKTWGLARLNNVVIPPEAETISIRVRGLSGGKWVVKMNGKLAPPAEVGDDAVPDTWLPFGISTALGRHTIALDKRVRSRIVLEKPLASFEIGLEGAPGAYVIIDDIRFPTR